MKDKSHYYNYVLYYLVVLHDIGDYKIDTIKVTLNYEEEEQ